VDAIIRLVVVNKSSVTYEYISKRLTGEIVQQYEADQSSKQTSLSWGFKWLSLTRSKRQPDFRNPHDMAKRATDAVSEWTGTLDAPGPYIAGCLRFQFARVMVHLGFEESNQLVAGLFADEELPEIGRAFVALFGSVTNLRGWKRKDAFQGDLHPSDAAGLYEILDASLEPTDSKVDGNYLADDRDFGGWDRFRTARSFVKRSDTILKPSEPYDFLAENHLIATDVDLFDDHYDVAMLGTPIWVRTVAPVPFATEEN